ncbi:TetR/AcrR family transcriptional regulator [Actinomadura algeriensis]|uniref:AcrR family transcriptional regulator n=1 Tax=Actinomadura algeriensis TaxID=1679523 RepID=A0ABR9JUR8_9ACTN|nr:TetR/AcrR family transcriptional regulator [Actinomadura algeriensis]MBE1534305.1 AcrR family transcriptional regulator [Actinomadura algeriensis]
MTSTAEPRPMRADARRNRRRVLDAARVAFEEGGAEVQMEDIARRAGVGVGTIYRHFPTKQALVDELIDEWLADGAANAAEALRIDDPWEGLAHFVRLSAEVMARNRGLRMVFGDIGLLFDENTGHQNRELHDNATRLLARAHAAGTLRADVGLREFRTLMCGLAMTVSLAGPDERRLYADVFLQGLHT